MKNNYKLVKVSKTTARELVCEALASFGNLKADKPLLDKVTNDVYNRLRRQANVEKIDSSMVYFD